MSYFYPQWQQQVAQQLGQQTPQVAQQYYRSYPIIQPCTDPSKKILELTKHSTVYSTFFVQIVDNGSQIIAYLNCKNEAKIQSSPISTIAIKAAKITLNPYIVPVPKSESEVKQHLSAVRSYGKCFAHMLSARLVFHTPAFDTVWSPGNHFEIELAPCEQIDGLLSYGPKIVDYLPKTKEDTTPENVLYHHTETKNNVLDTICCITKDSSATITLLIGEPNTNYTGPNTGFVWDGLLQLKTDVYTTIGNL